MSSAFSIGRTQLHARAAAASAARLAPQQRGDVVQLLQNQLLRLLHLADLLRVHLERISVPEACVWTDAAGGARCAAGGGSQGRRARWGEARRAYFLFRVSCPAAGSTGGGGIIAGAAAADARPGGRL